MLKIQLLCFHAGQSKGVDLWQMDTCLVAAWVLMGI